MAMSTAAASKHVEDLVSLRNSTITFSLALDPSQPKSEWSLSEGFVVEEGNDLLPPKNMDRTNLVECYHALLLATLMEEGLFEVSILLYMCMCSS